MLVCVLAGLTNAQVCTLLGDINHKVVERIRTALDRERLMYCEKKQASIVFGSGTSWRDVEADETCFGKYADDDAPDTEKLTWNQWAGLIERGRRDSLVLVPTGATKTCLRAPGPGAIKLVDWKPLAHKYIVGKKVVLHTDRAKSYALKLPGVVHDSVRHCKKRVKINGRWVWQLPTYTKLVSHRLPGGGSLKTKAGTQIIDRVWGDMKKHMKHVKKSNARRVRLAVRSAQWSYWNRGADLWLATGEVLTMNRRVRDGLQ